MAHKHYLTRALGLTLVSCLALGAAAPVQFPPGVYAVDTAHSRVSAKVPYFGLSSMAVTFPKIDGNLAYDEANSQAFKLDVNVDATALEGSSAWVNTILKGPDFFKVADFPTISFRGTKIAVNGARSARVEGDMTIRGITRPIGLDVAFDETLAEMTKAGQIAFIATAQINRRDFGMTAYPMVVGQKVALTINVNFVRG
jgi:polyisoprenoid-binding protein YceI